MLVRHSVVKPFQSSVYCQETCCASRYRRASSRAEPYHYARHTPSQRLRVSIAAAVARANSSDHSDTNFRRPEFRKHAPLDRLVACLVYVLPICEGLMRYISLMSGSCQNFTLISALPLPRLAVVWIRIAQYNLLDWLIWTDLRESAIKPGMDMVSHAVFLLHYIIILGILQT